MFDFKAYFWGSDVYINEKYRYDTNEILTAYLNNSRAKYLLKSYFVRKLKCFKCCLNFSPYMNHYNFTRYKALAEEIPYNHYRAGAGKSKQLSWRRCSELLLRIFMR